MAKDKGLPGGREPLASVLEVGQYLKVSRAGVYNMMERGELPYFMIGRRRRCRWSDVEAIIERNRRGQTVEVGAE